MKAQAWKIWICEGVLGATHGMFYPVIEIFIPELDLAINEAGFHIWDCQRYQPKVHTEDELVMDHDWEKHQPTMLREIEIEPDISEAAKNVVKGKKAKDRLEEIFTSLFGDLFETEE